LLGQGTGERIFSDQDHADPVVALHIPKVC
jgi:hypothetical protein